MRAPRHPGTWSVPAERAPAATAYAAREVERARVTRALSSLPPALGWQALDDAARGRVVDALDAYRARRCSGVLALEDVSRALLVSWPAWEGLAEGERAARAMALAAALEVDALG